MGSETSRRNSAGSLGWTASQEVSRAFALNITGGRGIVALDRLRRGKRRIVDVSWINCTRGRGKDKWRSAGDSGILQRLASPDLLSLNP